MNGLRNDFALPAAILFAMLAWALITYGGNAARTLALFALYIGAIGQFLAQSPNQYVIGAAVALCYLAILMAGAAAIVGVI